MSASRPWTAQRPASAGISSNVHLLSSGSTLPESTVSDEIFLEDDASDLTHGDEFSLSVLPPPTPLSTPSQSSSCFIHVLSRAPTGTDGTLACP